MTIGSAATGTARNPVGSRTPCAPARLTARAAALSGLALLAACTSTQSQMNTAGATLPQPQAVIVDSFAASPDEVKLNEGLSAEVEKIVKGGGGTTRTEQELDVGHQVADAVADKLVVEIQDLGLRAQRGSAVPAGVQPAVLIKGQLVSIDEGNRAERVIVGLGAGRSDVRAQTQVYEVTSTGSRLIDRIEVDGKSGLTPGMAETMGAGAVTGRLLVSATVGGGVHAVSETMGDTVIADGDRAAKGIAKQLATLFAQQGWIRR